MFKIINLIFDLPRVVYVLSFERERIEKVLNKTQEFNIRFAEKIIQQEITVYPVEREQFHMVCKECVNNLLLAYGVSFKQVVEYDIIVDVLVRVIPNIRALKRVINSVFTQVFCEEYGLYKRDLLAIEIIRFLNVELYRKIQKNAKYFVSYERSTIENHEVHFRSQEYTTRTKEILGEIIEEYNDYKELLKEMFPNVKRVIGGEEIISLNSQNMESKKESIRDARICNGQCFDLYFSFGTNEYLLTKDIVEKTINKINAAKSYAEIEVAIINLLSSDSKDSQKDLLNRFTNYIDMISALKRKDLIIAFIKNSRRISDRYEFLIRSPYDSVITIVRELLLKCSIIEVDDIVNKVSEEYQSLSMIEAVIHRLKQCIHDESNQVIKTTLNGLEKMYHKIIDEKINIYSNTYYRRNNASALFRHYRDKDINIFYNYLSSIISKENVYKVLSDIVEDSIGEQYNYTIYRRRLIEYFPNTILLGELLEQKRPFTEAEKMLYRNYKRLITEQTESVEESRDVAVEWEV